MPNYGLTGGYGGSNCICSLPTLVVLILIVLQFSRHKDHEHYDDEDEGFESKHVGNEILFIISLFFLSCAGCGRGNLGY